jgi:hypothetical protein
MSKVFDPFMVRGCGPSTRKEGTMSQVIANDPIGPAVYGDSASGPGVLGDSSSGNGVFGYSGSGPGVWGYSHYGTGVWGYSDTSGPGVSGESTSGVGVKGYSASATGVFGDSSSGNGVFGYSGSGNGVYGDSGSGPGVLGFSNDGIGVYGFSNEDVGVWGDSSFGLAGFFTGIVNITGELIKTGGGFRIDHPLDPAHKYLCHSFVESPDMKNFYDGVAVLDAQGETIVELPPWFEALNQQFRYQLTPIGAAGPHLHIAEEISDRRFKIAGGVPGMKVCWQVTGSRKDPWAQANPLTVEQEKSDAERDHYLHPELYGRSREQSIAWVHHPEVLHRSTEEQQKTRED